MILYKDHLCGWCYLHTNHQPKLPHNIVDTNLSVFPQTDVMSWYQNTSRCCFVFGQMIVFWSHDRHHFEDLYSIPDNYMYSGTMTKHHQLNLCIYRRNGLKKQTGKELNFTRITYGNRFRSARPLQLCNKM